MKKNAQRDKKMRQQRLNNLHIQQIDPRTRVERLILVLSENQVDTVYIYINIKNIYIYIYTVYILFLLFKIKISYLINTHEFTNENFSLYLTRDLLATIIFKEKKMSMKTFLRLDQLPLSSSHLSRISWQYNN